MVEPADKRRYARIEASLVCSMATASDVVDGVVANVSKSGAAIIASLSAARVGDTVTLMLEREEGLVSLSLPGTVVRKDVDEERARYGVQFEPLPPGEEEQLGLLLQLLVNGRGQGRRAHPRISTRVDVVCRTEEIFRGWVSDLSRGGLSIKSVRDVAAGQPIAVSFGVRGLKGLVEVSGEVMSSQPVEGGFRLGIQFVPLTATEQAQVNRTLDLLLDIALPDGEVLEDDET
jgi:c-di-GMP-binding flagellar brake protein YcgR